jgi:HEPN domain-containing protein
VSIYLAEQEERMNRSGLQRLTRIRAREARVLLSTKHPSGAYYLAGYVIECALKACIAKQTRRFDFPEKSKVLQSFTHSLRELLRAASLESAMVTDSGMSPELAKNWKTVQQWDESSRYEEWTQAEANALLTAALSRNGVVPWITRRW